MSEKKQLHSLSKLDLIYEENPGSFLDETDVDGYFRRIIFDVYQSHHRIVEVISGSNKNKFAIKLL